MGVETEPVFRLHSFDSVRGFAILLMILDHFFAIVFLLAIDQSVFRIIARLAAPLFGIVFGYFLANRSKEKLKRRMLELFVAALFVNAFFFTQFGKFDILVSFLLSACAYLALGDFLVYIFPVIFLLPFDPTAQFLDYPLALMLSWAACGISIRKGIAPIYAISYLLMGLVLPFSFNITCYASILAIAMVMGANAFPMVSLPLLSKIGRHPLVSYVIQFMVLIIIALVSWAIFGVPRSI